MTDEPKKTGRPAKEPEDKLQVVPVRLNAAQKATLHEIGQQALRDWLDKRGKAWPAQRVPSNPTAKRAPKASAGLPGWQANGKTE